ncbi:MAG: branched-chain amino acid ABC transporter permease, partial [Pseudomonadota bacterium]
VYGLEFAIAATFIAMTFGDLNRYPVLAAVVISGVASILLQPMLPDSYILVAAMIGMAAAFMLDQSELEEAE